MAPKTHLPLVFLYTSQSDGIEGATRFQKLVFLTQEEENLKEYYEFRADRFGPYSIELRSDLDALVQEGYIERNVVPNNYGWHKIVYSLTPEGIQKSRELLDRGNDTVFDIIQKKKQEYNERSISDLLQYVYQRYDEYVKATDLDTDAIFDPDARSEFEQIPKRDRMTPSTVGDMLAPTPHTLYQMPKRDTNAYFYYFTDHSYTNSDSKFSMLDEQLTLFGRYRSHVEVAMVDRDKIRAELWDTLIDGFEIDDYPALVVADRELGVRDVDLGTPVFSPAEADYAVIQNGVIVDSILSDSDKLRDFLNGLFDCARDGTLENGMKKRKVIEGLTLTKQEIKSILTISA